MGFRALFWRAGSLLDVLQKECVGLLLLVLLFTLTPTVAVTKAANLRCTGVRMPIPEILTRLQNNSSAVTAPVQCSLAGRSQTPQLVTPDATP